MYDTNIMHLCSNRDKNIERKDATVRLNPRTMTPSVNCAYYLFSNIIRYVCISIGVTEYCMLLI